MAGCDLVVVGRAEMQGLSSDIRVLRSRRWENRIGRDGRGEMQRSGLG